MKKENAESEIRKLEEEIRHHQYLYYVKNEPVISDRDFDFLFKKLQKLEEENPKLASPNSPTKMVGSDLDNDFEKFKHTVPVLSLENTYSTEELSEWLQKTDPKGDYSVEWKVDGASIVLYYQKGELYRAVTRGTGGVGDDITENIRTVRNIPLVLPEKIDLTVRGEVYMTFKDFDKINARSVHQHANPRNLASGTIKSKNSYKVAERPLRICIYEGYIPGKRKIETHHEMLKYLRSLHFPISDDNVIIKADKIIATVEKFKKKKSSLGYPTDGLVIKHDSFRFREESGFTSHSPRWARALKFDAEMKETRILKIDLSVGRTGKITPRAEVEPVQLAGSTVRFATLHNQDYIDDLGAGIGAVVRVAKRGEIIPAVEAVVEAPEKVFKIPAKCPSCGKPLAKKDDSVDIFCSNTVCPGRQVHLLRFFVEKKQMDIEGFGEKQIDLFYEKGWIRTVPDIYDLHKYSKEIVKTPGFGEKSLKILLDGIEKSKKKDFAQILPSVSLSEVGHKVTEILFENGYDSLESLLKLAESKKAMEELASIHGIGEKIAESIVNSFRDKAVIKLFKELEKKGLVMKTQVKKVVKGDVFAGQSWCVTGSFANFAPRENAMKIVTEYGGKSVSGVSSKTTHLLHGEGAGSKLDKAKSLGVKLVDEDEFIRILEENEISY
ncbi:MAG TPA: NAD-dependent DNA ligase LigA [Leptospiraceae bacterium]|nr:NAD-dependent DNA ligase LigA [Leptospiraceae bacterium]HMY68864.1 NAD-dependent DNA ligase LigA [Leptospiraceae bacterium]HNF15455.1 NAD-dependent DNA ligase LigA [Leptospiraceae bacterium]HNF26747.1 NAD-dependent DNA ligase LigA [Leptospiraceae bacterium]HNM02468.1 NAD-dependent DNA ligase LigA [Leptospiraceae bacterium]